MATLAHSRNHHKRFTSHNRAISPDVKAANVARSIVDNGLSTLDEATWARYGLAENPAQRLLVLSVLARNEVAYCAASSFSAKPLTA